MVLNSRIFGEFTFFSTARWRVSCLRCCGETATNLKIWREISYRFGKIFTNLKAVSEHQVQLCSLEEIMNIALKKVENQHTTMAWWTFDIAAANMCSEEKLFLHLMQISAAIQK